MKKRFLTAALLTALLPAFLMAQNLWSPADLAHAQPPGERFIEPSQFRAVALDLSFLKKKLEAAPDWFAPQLVEKQSVALELPMPDGSSKTFRIWRADVLHPDLAARFPEIKSYAGHEKGDRSTSVRLDIGPRGFHAMVLSASGPTVFIDPIWMGDTEHYQSYFKKDLTPKTGGGWLCHSTENGLPSQKLDLPKELQLPADDQQPETENLLAGDCGKLRKYRLALACTGEYATFCGGTTALTLAAMNTSMTRINGIYERELGVTMQIVANNDQVIYLNAATDPYSNTDLGSMIDANQLACDSKIGAANYDVGHVFTKANLGGLACLFCPCTASKARAGSSLNSPVGDPFDVDYVSHEMGHQFGGRHTQNQNGCNADSQAAVEPGSGSTIMAYAGVCAPNVQNFSDDYFNAVNLKQMGQFITTGTGSTCPTVTNTGNTAPTAAAPTDKTLPISTPFVLTGSGSDANSDPITFCWEQQDIAIGTTMPPVGTNATGPMFRTFKGTANPTRSFPRLSDLANGTNYDWEELPAVARTMNFRLTVRDNRPGGGCTAEDDIKLTFSAAAGPLAVTAPNTTGISWDVGTTQTVTWNVANTNAAPINCPTVNILLSTDGGLTYPTTLASAVPNSGSAPVTTPNLPTTTARIRVEAVGNYFFDISDKNFTIKLAATFAASPQNFNPQTCGGTAATVGIDIQSVLGFSAPVSLSATGNPPGSTVSFSQNPAAPGSVVQCTISPISVAVTTVFPITITAVSGVISQSFTINLTVAPSAPASAAALTAPANFATGLGTAPALSWSAVPGATVFLVEISTSPAFQAGQIVASGSPATAGFTPTNLSLSTVYYWRVKASNGCGEGPWSQTFAFETGAPACSQTFNSTDVPKTISATAADSVVSVLNVPAGWAITDLNVSANISHTWVGDLSAKLVAPSGATRQLFDRPGVPVDDFGCDRDNIAATFDDEAAMTAAQFENSCANAATAISGNFKSIDALSAFDGPEATGQWRLVVADHFSTEDGGAVNSWGITICYASPIVAAVLLKNDPLSVPKSGSGGITQGHLLAKPGGTAGQFVFTVTAPTTGGVLLKNGQPLGLGGTFTQADINGGLVIYQHSGGAAAADQFTFDLFDQSGANWLPGQVFQINIVQNTLAASLSLTQNPGCAGGATAAVEASATGGTAPLEYALNGGSFQQSPVFSGLAAGNYTVVVKDANGFTISTNTVAAVDPPALTASTTIASDDVTASGTGGTGSLTYSIDGQNFSPNPLFEDLPNAVYTITVKDANGCTATAQAVVAVNTLLVGASETKPVSCAGGSDGAVFINVGGGQSPFSIQLSNGTTQPDGLFENLPAGAYSAVVTDAQGFTATSNVTVLADPVAITASVSTSYYEITVAASGGTGGLTYSLDGGAFQPSPIFLVDENGDFTITIRDQNGCETTVKASVNVPLLTADAVVASPILCNGQQTAIVAATGSGGQPPYQFSLDGASFQPSNQFTGLGAGLYTIYIKDAAGKVSTAQVAVSEPSAVAVAATVFGKKITATASGGTGALTFSIDGQVFSSQNVFENLGNGAYTVFGQDANGCVAAVEVSVNYQPVVLSVEVVQPSCFGLADGSAAVATTGGIAPFEYSLDGVVFTQNLDLTGLAAGDYTVYCLDATGEVVSQNFTLDQPAQVTITASVAGPDISFEGMGGAGNFTYLVNGVSNGPATVFENAPPGDYTITAVDDNGCSASTTVTVEPSTLSLNVLEVKAVSCAGGTDGSFTACVNGGQPPYSVVFSPNNGQSTTLTNPNCQLAVQLTGLAAGSYGVTVTDAFGIDQLLTISLPEPPALGATATSTGANGSSTVTVVGTGGTGVLTYSLDGGAFQPSNIFTGVADGNHSIVVKDENGCTATTSIFIMTIATGEAGSEDFGLRLLPNPTGGELQIVVNDGVGSVFFLKMTDAAGRLLFSEKTVLPRMLDLSGLPGGTYFLWLADGERAAVRRVVRI